MHGLRLMVAVALISAAFPAAAVQPDEVLPDAAMESRARALSKDLRCMVCQNQSIDDSDAPLARDLRVLVRERLKAGDSDTQVIDYLVSRYGEFVLLNPRLGRHTLILWLGPLAVLIAGALGLVLLLRRRRRESVPELVATKALTPAEEARLAKLLDQPGAGSPTDREAH